MKIFEFKNNKEKGFTLVETLIAISIFSMSILALVVLLGQDVSSISYAKKKITAVYLAQEGIEYIRNMRDDYVLYPANGSWANFKSKLAQCNIGGECGFDVSLYPTDSASVFKCTANAIGCSLYVSNGDYNSIGNGSDSGFSRTITMQSVSSDEVKITSIVSWEQNSVPFNITLTEELFNWAE